MGEPIVGFIAIRRQGIYFAMIAGHGADDLLRLAAGTVHQLKAIRENEPRAILLGYDVDKYKLLAFVLSTTLAGLAGALKTVALGFATLSDAHWSISGEVVLMTLVGGMGTFAGPVVGAFTIIGLQNFLADRVGSWVTVIIVICGVCGVCGVGFRCGFVGELLAWLKRRQPGKP